MRFQELRFVQIVGSSRDRIGKLVATTGSRTRSSLAFWQIFDLFEGLDTCEDDRAVGKRRLEFIGD